MSGKGDGSNSCPTSPQLRKASPALSEEARGSGRGKKCTRFMDQVSEIESHADDCQSIGELQSDVDGKGGDCVSLRSVLSSASGSSVTQAAVGISTSAAGDNQSGNHTVSRESSKSDNLASNASLVSNNAESVSSLAGHTVTSSVSSFGTNALSSVSSVSPSDEDVTKGLASCESLPRESVTRCGGGGHLSLGSGGRVKAESTSVLNTGADYRRSEMGGARRRSDCCYRDDLTATVNRSLNRKKSTPRDKEHRSQPGNLSDISEMKGMPVLPSAALSDLLTVADTSCESVFLESTCTKGRPVSCLSIDDQAETLSSQAGDVEGEENVSGDRPKLLAISRTIQVYDESLPSKSPTSRTKKECYESSEFKQRVGRLNSPASEQNAAVLSDDQRDCHQSVIAHDQSSLSLTAADDQERGSPRSVARVILESSL